MPDPFDALRAPDRPADPDPAFAARLRARVERALALPRGVLMPSLLIDDDTTTTAAATAVTPYLAVAGARDALDWYADAFGARRRGEPIVMPDGRIGHAELEVGGAVFMLADEHPEIGFVAPDPDGAVTVLLHLDVPDVDATVRRAVAAGARLERPVGDFDYGRTGQVRDPFGHRWQVFGTATEPRSRHGDIGYVSLWVPDGERAAAFFATTLGWQYAPAAAAGHARQVEGHAPQQGLFGGEPRSTLFLCFAVDDAAAALERVRAAGGHGDEPHPEPYGLLVECTDDQGTRFAMFEPPGGTVDGPAPDVGSRPGDLTYVTMEVVDSARTRAFYGAVLGWRFAPGRVEDGWQVDGPVPMVGISGGHDQATTVPMYRVADVAAAVGRVRRAGGTATDPAAQPYGITADCVDDQGTRFYLGEL